MHTFFVSFEKNKLYIKTEVFALIVYAHFLSHIRNFKRIEHTLSHIKLPKYYFLFIFIILLLYWGYIVTFAKVPTNVS
jgi:hypothetical protein